MRSDFRLHVDEAIEFLKYVVIKFQYFESYMNGLPQYANRTDINPDDKTTFPYYRMMIGDASFATEYLEGYDPNTGGYVALTPEVLLSNPTMLSFYLDSEGNLNELLLKYKNDQYLIMRMFYPVPSIEAAVSAPDFSVLFAPRGKLDLYEELSIIEGIGRFTEYFGYRWYMNTMEYEELQPLAMWSMLWYLLTPVVMSTRIQNLRSGKVHPFYIWEYLVSRGYNNYSGYLNRSQEHFLYRNDNFLQQNVGKKFVLEILEKEFLRPIKHTLKEKVVVCHTDDGVYTGTKSSHILSNEDGKIVTSSLTEFDTFLTDLYNNGYDVDNSIEYKAAVTEDFKYAPSNKLYTKFLELQNSSMNEDVMMLGKFLIDSFVYLVSEDLVKYNVSVQLHSTGKEIFDIPILICLNLMYYCIYKATGETPTETIKYYTTSMAITNTEDPIFPSSVFVAGLEYEIDSLVSDVVNDVPYCGKTMFTSSATSNFLARQFDWLRDGIATVDTASDTVLHEAYLAVYEELVPPVKVLKLPQPFFSFAEIFAEFPDVADLLASITDRDQYSELYIALFDKLIPVGIGFAELAKDVKNNLVVEKMKELFTYLTSYNITFISNSVDRMDVYRLVPLLAHLGGGVGSSVIHAFDDTLIHGDYEFQLGFKGEIRLYDEVGLLASMIPEGGTWHLEVEGSYKLDTFVYKDIGKRDLLYYDFGNTIEIESTL